MLERITAIENWLSHQDDLKLEQLARLSRSLTIPLIAQWMVQHEWLPDVYDETFPYPTVPLSKNAPSESIGLN